MAPQLKCHGTVGTHGASSERLLGWGQIVPEAEHPQKDCLCTSRTVSGRSALSRRNSRCPQSGDQKAFSWDPLCSPRRNLYNIHNDSVMRRSHGHLPPLPQNAKNSMHTLPRKHTVTCTRAHTHTHTHTRTQFQSTSDKSFKTWQQHRNSTIAPQFKKHK